MNINITPEDVDLMVKDAILKAGLGKAINEAVAKLFSGYNNPLEDRIRQFVGEIASQLLREKFSEQVKTLVADQIEQQVTKAMLENVTSEAVKRMAKAAEFRY